MRILIDENLSRSLAVALRVAGHDVEDVRDVGLRGKPDPEVFALAVAGARVLVTGDVGFGDVVAYPPGSYPGIIVARVPTSVPTARLVDVIVRAVNAIEGDPSTAGALVIVTEASMRVRRPMPPGPT